MTALQKSIYNDALRRSRKTIFDLEENEGEAPPATNTRGKQTKKKTRANARTKDKLYLENSANVLMDLRKAALHPMLFRRRYTDETLTAIAKVLLKEPEYRQRGAIFQYVKEDMEVMTDAELQVFCHTYKVSLFSGTYPCIWTNVHPSRHGSICSRKTVTSKLVKFKCSSDSCKDTGRITVVS